MFRGLCECRLIRTRASRGRSRASTHSRDQLFATQVAPRIASLLQGSAARAHPQMRAIVPQAGFGGPPQEHGRDRRLLLRRPRPLEGGRRELLTSAVELTQTCKEEASKERMHDDPVAPIATDETCLTRCTEKLLMSVAEQVSRRFNIGIRTCREYQQSGLQLGCRISIKVLGEKFVELIWRRCTEAAWPSLSCGQTDNSWPSSRAL